MVALMSVPEGEFRLWLDTSVLPGQLVLVRLDFRQDGENWDWNGQGFSEYLPVLINKSKEGYDVLPVPAEIGLISVTDLQTQYMETLSAVDGIQFFKSISNGRDEAELAMIDAIAWGKTQQLEVFGLEEWWFQRTMKGLRDYNKG